MVALAYPEFAWPAAGTTSKAQRLNGATITGFRTPAGFSGTSITFLAAEKEDGTYLALTDISGAAITLTTAASKQAGVLPATFASVDWVKLVSSTSEAAGTVVRAVVREVL